MRNLNKAELAVVSGAGATATGSYVGLAGTYTPSPEAAAYIAAVKTAIGAHITLLRSMAIRFHTGALAHLQASGK